MGMPQPPSMTSLSRGAVTVLALALAWRLVFTPRPPPAHCAGHAHPAFQEVKDAFCESVASGAEPGASFAVYRSGEPLVNVWGGYADRDSRRPWTAGTVSQVWSSTKAVTAVVMALLVDRGVLDYKKPVKTYWPEFGCNGKDNLTVAQLLSHQAGLLYLSRKLTLFEYRDNWDEVETMMAKQAPHWTPGSKCGYHAFTFGMYADALVRKVDPKHRNISQFFRDEIATPLDLDFYIGLPLDQSFRSARASYVTLPEVLVDKFVLKPNMWRWIPEVLTGTLLEKSLNVFDFMDDMNKLNNPDLQSIGMSSIQGFGTAASLARLFDYLANDGSVQGRRFMSSAQVSALSTPVTAGLEVVAAPDLPVSMGMIVENNVVGQPVFGHRGYGGQNVYADPHHGIGLTYLTNFNSRYSDSDDPRALELLKVLYRCLEKYHASTTP